MEAAVINLKVELEKRKASVQKKLIGEKSEVRFNKTHKKDEKLSEKSIKNKSKSKAYTSTSEEENELEKSRLMLERKAAMYDKIKSGCEVLQDDELNDRFLINFQKKIKEDYETKQYAKSEEYELGNENNEWVEYIDPLGRTRKCLKKDLEFMKTRDKELMSEPEKPEDPEMARAEEARMKLHEQWNKVEEESKNKVNIHYQDILFDEARQHGVGFVKFSRDESEREAQKQLLNELRDETKKAEKESKAARKESNKRMTERLAKVRQRKRLKMGLPIKDLHAELIDKSSSSEDEEIAKEKQHTPDVSSKKPTTTREWDIGKGPPSVMDQGQWIQSRRKVRSDEFAPPQFYSK